jgi:hypothetical protein
MSKFGNTLYGYMVTNIDFVQLIFVKTELNIKGLLGSTRGWGNGVEGVVFGLTREEEV